METETRTGKINLWDKNGEGKALFIIVHTHKDVDGWGGDKEGKRWEGDTYERGAHISPEVNE